VVGIIFSRNNRPEALASACRHHKSNERRDEITTARSAWRGHPRQHESEAVIAMPCSTHVENVHFVCQVLRSPIVPRRFSSFCGV